MRLGSRQSGRIFDSRGGSAKKEKVRDDADDRMADSEGVISLHFGSTEFHSYSKIRSIHRTNNIPVPTQHAKNQSRSSMGKLLFSSLDHSQQMSDIWL